jgi:hypothetical protein
LTLSAGEIADPAFVQVRQSDTEQHILDGRLDSRQVPTEGATWKSDIVPYVHPIEEPEFLIDVSETAATGGEVGDELAGVMNLPLCAGNSRQRHQHAGLTGS